MYRKTLILASLVLLTLLFYVVQIFNANNNQLSFFIKPIEHSKQPHIVLYLSDESHQYTEKNSVQNFTLKNEKYTFLLPSLKNISSIRIDPAQKKGKFLLKDITLIQNSWFKQTIYTIPTQFFTPTKHIINFSKTESTLQFETTGNDPQLDVTFELQTISSWTNYHFAKMIIAVLATILLYILFSLHKSYLKTQDALLLPKVLLYIVAFSFAIFKVDYYSQKVKYFHPPDEAYHIAYVKYVHNNTVIVPEFEKMKGFNNRSINYLTHPPLYYYIANLVYNDNLSLKENIPNFRQISKLLFIVSFLLLLYLAWQTNMHLLGHFTFLSIVSSIPMYAYLGGSVNNDTLAILSGVLFMFAFKQLLDEKFTWLTYLLLGLSFLIGFYSKLTVSLLMFFALLFYLIYLLFHKKMLSITLWQFILVALFVLPIVYYQANIFFNYHAIVPTLNHTNPEAYYQSNFFIPEEHRHYLSPYEWFERVLGYIQGGWFGIHAHRSLGKENIVGYLGLFLLHIIAILALFLKCKDKKLYSYCLLGKFTLLAILSVEVVQYLFSYKGHLNSGYWGGIQPRYLLPFLGAFAIMASVFIDKFSKYKWLHILIVLVCLHAIYSDFFYFLRHYIY